MQESKTIIKKSKKPLIKKFFRLFDFNIYDEIQVEDDSDNSSDSSYGNEKNKKFAKDEKIFVIQMFGVNEKGETCSLYVKDFQPFFFILIGKEWKNREMIEMVKEIKTKIGKKYQDSIVKHEIVEYKKLYGFTAGKRDKFVKLTFKNTEVMNRVKNLWYTYTENQERKKTGFKFLNTNLELYESGNIPPLLRFFHINEISPSGWISFYLSRVMRSETKTTTCDYEYVCPLKEIKPEPTKLDRVPFKICSFDIEASSSHGDFPIPVKTYKRLASNIIDTFYKQSSYITDITLLSNFIQKAILTAFGYSKFDGIDVVYPKTKPTKDRTLSLIKILLNESLENAKKANTEEDNTNLLRIDNMFESMIEKQNQGNNIESSENIIAIENEDDMNNGDSDNDDDSDKEDEKTPVFKKTTKKSVSPDKITDILFNKDLKRDEKIQILNDVLTRLFPRLEGDKVTFIGSTFLRYGEQEPYMNHCVVLGSCDPVEGVIIDPVNNEKTLLLKWSELMQKENPDIIIGYNIFGFDYEFLFRRAEENECVRDFMLLSRKIGEMSAKQKRDNPSQLDIETTKLAIASGEYDLRYFKMTGRLQIDLYATFRRDYIMSSYKLDDVAGQFICDSINRSEHVEDEVWGKVTELYSKNLMGIHVNDFIHIELSGYTTEYHKRGQKFKVLHIYRDREVIENVKGQEKTVLYNVLVIEGHEIFDKTKSIKWGMAKDDVSPKDIFRLANGSSSDRAIVAKYCIQDCNLVHHLINKVDCITGFSEMANICCVPISFLIFRGQGIKLTSFVAKKCMENQMLMPDLEKSNDFTGYQGAIVLPPKCAMYIDNPVACVDYSSLYPSAMISQNYSHDSLVWVKEYDLDNILIKEKGERNNKGEYEYDNLPGYEYIDIEYDNFIYMRAQGKEKSAAKKTKIGKIVCRWAQLPGKKSILPSILQELLKARSDTRKLIKTEKDPFMQNILDKRQLAYKVTANSLYGQCGSRTSSFYQKNIAACTTATGRTMITYARRMIEEVYGDSVCNTLCYGVVKTAAEYVYGDTDSVFFTFNLRNAETNEKIVGKPALEITIELAKEAAKLCSQWLKTPMELAYEKTLMPFILLSKKRYVGILYEDDANKGKLKYMGLPLKRRDSCDIVKDIYGGVLDILLKSTDTSLVILYLNQQLENLISGNISMEKLMITKALRSDYKNPESIGHNVLAERIGERDPGNKPKSGDRIKFVFIVNNNKKALQGHRMETPEFIIENNIKIDYIHYINNQIMKPLQQLIGLDIENILSKIGKHGIAKEYRKQIKKLGNDFPDLELFMKKKEKISAAEVKKLIFDKIIQKVHNEQNGIRTINDFFSK
jgi:DNA polymerase elongation subunit (family B)